MSEAIWCFHFRQLLGGGRGVRVEGAQTQRDPLGRSLRRAPPRSIHSPVRQGFQLGQSVKQNRLVTLLGSHFVNGLQP